MFNSIKNLFEEMVQTVKKTDFRNLYSRAVKGTKDNISDFRYKVTHLFDTNLQNGLNHYYLGHYKDALIRFKIMNSMWKNHPVVHYNLGRAYFELEKHSKAEIVLQKAIDLNHRLARYYLAKIQNVENVLFVPSELKAEFYDYSLDSFASEYSIHETQLRQIFDIYDRYIGSLAIEKGENQVSILDIGCHVGLFGKFCRQTYKKIHINGLDVSEEMTEYCRRLTVRKDESVYNFVFHSEMHGFLNANLRELQREKSKEIVQNVTESNGSTRLAEYIKGYDLLNQNYSDDNTIFLEAEAQNDEFSEKNSAYENLQTARFYDVIISIGTFGEFGELSTILQLCEINLLLGGIIVFVVSKSTSESIQFSKYRDSFYYTESYINSVITQHPNLKLLEMKILPIIHPENNQIIVILRKVN